MLLLRVVLVRATQGQTGTWLLGDETCSRGGGERQMGSGNSSGLIANPINALPQEGSVLIPLLLFHYTASTITLNEYRGRRGRLPGPGFQWVHANRKQEETLMGRHWQSPEVLHIS